MTKPDGVFPAQPFHQKFLMRIASLNIMLASSVALAERIVEDSETKVPADKIQMIGEEMINKIIDVQGASSEYTKQVLPLLVKADASLKAQIDFYRQNGDMSDPLKGDTDTSEIGDVDHSRIIDPEIAARSVGAGSLAQTAVHAPDK